MESRGERLKHIRILAWLLAVLSFSIVLISAYIRLYGAGLGCAEWPVCYGQLLVGGPHPHVGMVRIMHRVTAALSLLVGFATVWRCLRPTPIQPVARYATWLLVLMILLTLVGLWSSDPHRVWASFINIIGGLVLVALAGRLVLAVTGNAAPTIPSRFGLLFGAGLASLSLTLVVGALIGARYAAASCLTLPECGGYWWPEAEGWASLNPFARISAASAPGDRGGVTLHLLHRYGAAASLLLLGTAGLRMLANNATRQAAKWLLALLVLEVALGSLTVASGFKLWLAVAHSVCAAAVLAAAIQLRCRGSCD